MNPFSISRRSKDLLSKIIPGVFKSAFKLLDPKAKLLYLTFSSLQVLLAFLEVIALGILTLTITLGLNNFTNFSNGKENDLTVFGGMLVNVKVETQIAVLIGCYVLFTVVKTILSAIVTLSSLNFLAKQTVNIGFRLNTGLFERGINLLRFGRSQENLSGVTGSLDSLIIGYLGTFSQLLGDLATIFMVAVALLFFDFETSLLLIILFTLLLLTLHLFVNVVATRLGQTIATSTAKLNRRILDAWLVYREILLTQKVDDFTKPTLFERMEVARSRARLGFLPSLSKYIFELFLIFSALIVSGLQLWLNGISEAVSSFVLIAAASARLLPAVLRLQGNLLALKQSAGGAVFANRLLEAMPSKLHLKNSFISTKIHETEFEATAIIKNLGFLYPESTKPALEEVSLSIFPGTFVAITGASGSGKSTLIDLILGFLQPTAGSVLLSGMNPLAAQVAWPGKISYVPQDVQIFEGSILENITLSISGKYDENSLENSIESSGLFEDIDELANGIHTLVGERGLRLSGGQKQRLGIARALYSNPKLLVFDEATSSLDPITENKIANSVFQRLPDRAVIVVAHRLSTVMRADEVFYLKDGRVRASGKFSDLKKSEPEFLKQAELSGL